MLSNVIKASRISSSVSKVATTKTFAPKITAPKAISFSSTPKTLAAEGTQKFIQLSEDDVMAQYNRKLAAALKKQQYSEACKLHQQIQKDEKAFPNEVTYALLLSLYGKAKWPTMMTYLWNEMLNEWSMEPSNVCFNTTIFYLAKMKKTDEIKTFLKAMAQTPRTSLRPPVKKALDILNIDYSMVKA